MRKPADWCSSLLVEDLAFSLPWILFVKRCTFIIRVHRLLSGKRRAECCVKKSRNAARGTWIDGQRRLLRSILWIVELLNNSSAPQVSYVASYSWEAVVSPPTQWYVTVYQLKYKVKTYMALPYVILSFSILFSIFRMMPQQRNRAPKNWQCWA